MKLPIYLDYGATTPVDPKVAEKMFTALTLDGTFGNPASKSHKYGWEAAELVDIARTQIADLINADSRDIIFTSGATESDNLATIGVALSQLNVSKRRKIITSKIEHKAILDPCSYLEQQGFEVCYLTPNAQGIVTPQMLADVVDDNTLLVSLMHVNNEIGVIQDLKELAKVAHDKGALFHSDCAQSAGKVKIDVKDMNVDYLSFSAHKIYGPKGIGAFYVSKQAPKPQAIVHGGGHERGMRSGTLATHQIVGMGEAFALAKKRFKEDVAHTSFLQQKLKDGILAIPGTKLNGSDKDRVSTNLNITFTGVNGENFLISLRDIAVSTGSACTSASLNPSFVLKALGLSDSDAHSSIRFSIGRFTTEEEIDFAISYVKKAYEDAKQLGTGWNV